jgi:hypothetical protein
MKLIDLLTEKRKNPELNTKDTEYDQFKAIEGKYGSDNIYVRYVEDLKLGVNPQYNYNTPFGICAYPLKYVINQGGYVPFAHSRKYIIIFKVSDDASLWVLDNPITNKLVDDTEKALSKVLDIDKPTLEDIGDSMDLWYAIYDNVKKFGKHQQRNIHLTVTKILKQMGFDGAVDGGEGIIHINEPTQSIFFSAAKLTQLSTIVRAKSLNKVPKKLRNDPDAYVQSNDPSLFSQHKRMFPELSNDELVKKFPFIVPTMKNKSDEYLKTYFTWASNNLDKYTIYTPHILPLPIEYQIKIIQKDPKQLKTLSAIYKGNIDDRVALAAVHRDPWLVADISAPSSKVKMASIQTYESKYKDPDGVKKFIKLMFNGQYDKPIIDYLQKLPK